MGVLTAAVHRSAVEGYAAVGAAYERGRAGYPAEATVFMLQRLGALAESSVVVEVASGTGKFTRALLGAGVKPVAIEPVTHMRETFAATTPEVEVRDGAAEHLPLDDATADAVIAAQAFHWFDGTAALAEFRRVLRPGGGLGLLWNGQDRSLPWVAEIWQEIDARRGDTPNAWSYAWKDAFAAGSGFSALEYASFSFEPRTSREGLVDRVCSISFIARQPPTERESLASHVRRVCDERGLPDEFALPYTCHVYWCRRI